MTRRTQWLIVVLSLAALMQISGRELAARSAAMRTHRHR